MAPSRTPSTPIAEPAAERQYRILRLGVLLCTLAFMLPGSTARAQDLIDRQVRVVNECRFPVKVWVARYDSGEARFIAEGPWRFAAKDNRWESGPDEGGLERDGRLLPQRAERSEGIWHSEAELLFVRILGGANDPDRDWADFADHQWEVRTFETRNFDGSTSSDRYIGLPLGTFYEQGRLGRSSIALAGTTTVTTAVAGIWMSCRYYYDGEQP